MLTAPPRRALAVLGALVVLLGACAGDDGDAAPAIDPATTTVEVAPSTTGSTTTTSPVPWPALPDDGVARAVVTPAGFTLPVLGGGPGAYLVRTPCGAEATVEGTPLSGATVVLDPGHGGDEDGARGPTGVLEKDVNLGVARAAAARLEALGATVVLTRDADVRVTLRTRAELATALRPVLFLSIHHNAEADGPSDGPGTETYYQQADPSARRAAGLVWEEVVDALTPYDVAWVAGVGHGATIRRSADGGDYYGILRRSAGVPTVLSEAAFLSNPPEERLLADPEVQAVEGDALARAVARFVATDDPGSGFVDPVARTEPAGPGGGAAGCVDPPLG